MKHLLLLIMPLVAGSLLRAAEITHRFLAVDESRDQLLHVDQADPAKNWTIKLPGKHRDIQLVGKQVAMLSSPDGYGEYRLTDQKLVKQVKGYPGTQAARRLADGRTVLACNVEGVTLFELGADDKLIRKVSFKSGATRLVRFTPQGTWLIGSGNQVLEGDWTGKAERILVPAPSSWAYQSLRLANGNLLVAGGYNSTIFELDTKGAVVKTLGGKQAPEAKSLGYHFCAGLQILKNGDIVVCNWTGHGPQDSAKGAQLLQFNPAGQLVWKWHDPQRAGSLIAVIVLDDLDTAVLNDDISSVLGPVK